MNLMDHVINNESIIDLEEKWVKRIHLLKDRLRKERIKVTDKSVKLKDVIYYVGGLPIISKDRDVLKKPNGICKVRVNWKKKDFTGLSSSEIYAHLKEQYAWSVTTVDVEHTRNKFKNKSNLWVVFDTEKEALKYLNVFNALFFTAIEGDAVEEYKKFKENPAKRPLTFDKLIDNAYELYELVDTGEL